LQQIAQWQPTLADRAAPPLASCATMFFLGAAGKLSASDTSLFTLKHLAEQSPLHEVLSDGTSQEALRRLITSCVLNYPSKSEAGLTDRLHLIAICRLENALSLSLAVLEGKDEYARVAPLTKGFAILTLGQLGRSEHIAVLEHFLDDSTVGMAIRLERELPTDGSKPQLPQMTVQMRDFALVALLQLTRQSPTDYGFQNAKLTEYGAYVSQTLYRDNDDRRAEAIAKWRQWRTAHK
jgi:hypothetical protein